MKWPFEMTVCWDVEMVICWDVENVFWCWLTVSISEAFRWGCMCYVRYRDDLWSKCWWLMFFLKKTWSNECVWGSINDHRWRKKMVKWMWCCYRVMGRQAVDLDVRAASDVDAIRCIGGWMWCQDCCTRPWNGQMHAGGYLLMKFSGLHLMSMSSDALTVVLMSGLLHPIVKRSDALTVVYDVRVAASDRETVRCTGGCLWCQGCCTRSQSDQMRGSWCPSSCIWSRRGQMHWRSCLIVRLLHPTVKRSDARW